MYKNRGRRISDADMGNFIPYMDRENPKFRIYIAKILILFESIIQVETKKNRQ